MQHFRQVKFQGVLVNTRFWQGEIPGVLENMRLWTGEIVQEV